MNKTYGIIIFLLSLTLSLEAQSFSERDIRKSFNDNWKFILLEDTAQNTRPVNELTGWKEVNIPHDWSIEGTFSETNSGSHAWLSAGVGFYYKEFQLSEKDKGKYIEIQFDGVYRHSTISVNGKVIRRQYDGYTSFYLDITPFVHFDQKNTITVQVDNSDQPNCRWYSGSGIYRNVWMRITDPLHIQNWGTYIATPYITQKEATVEIKSIIENLDVSRSYTLENIILDPNGKEVVRETTESEANGYSEKEIRQVLPIPVPIMWSVKSPNLYKVMSTVRSEGEIINRHTNTFGIRTLQFDGNLGFFLNGKNMKLKGVCLHHAAGPFGAAVPLPVWKRRLEELKSIGCNAIRTAHNPPSPEFLDLCDELGFLVMDEFVDKWDKEVFSDPFFNLEWQQNYTSTIKRDRNHPSVIIWSVGNENHPPEDTRQRAGLKKYVRLVHDLDPSRPVVSGMERGKDKPIEDKVADIVESTKYMDLVALNYGEQWCQRIHEVNPDKPYVSTESYTYFNSELEKRFASIERSPWLDVIENDFNIGLFFWVGIDYLGESKKWPRLGSNSGLLDMAGFAKPKTELYRAFWSEEPVVSVAVYDGDADDFSTSGRWGWPPMQENWNIKGREKVDIVTYTNCESVKLYLNDQFIGEQWLKDIPNKIMKWKDVEYKEGTVKAIGYNNNVKVSEYEIRTTGAPKTAIIKQYESQPKPGDVIHLIIDLVDDNGIRVTDDDRELNFETEGAEILALQNGNIHDPFTFHQKNRQPTHRGKSMAIIKILENTKNVKIRVSGEKLKTSTHKINLK